jgi:hypothetical protein
MDGWVSVEDLVERGFDRSSVVMANEAHDGMRRCVRTREVGVRMVKAAHDAGVRRLAMEALPWPIKDVAGPIRELPEAVGGYLAQPEMRTLIGTALDLGWTLWAYEMQFEYDPSTDPRDFLTIRHTNRREREQAANIAQLLRQSPGEPLLVWCGNGHAYKESVTDWTPMGWHVRQTTDVDPFVIDQTITVQWEGRQERTVSLALDAMSDVLARLGGTAGILADQAPDPWGARTGVDAFVVAIDNAMT